MPVAPPLPLPPPPPPPASAPSPIQAPPAQITAAPPVSAEVAQSILSRYIGQIRAIILSNLVVPHQLIETGLSGTCVLRFTVSPSGEIISVAIISPSGIHDVNEAAMQALRSSRLPAFLAGMPQDNHEFTLPVHVSGQDE